ncbi:MAG: T9SS type A sorting domain-containing protein [Ignavibacteriales bacterium]|nr:T9SS type A sorting domain-containing protein [Ignavibacteriales bacterium]
MVGTTGVVMENSINSPNEFELFNNYPNPFNPTTTIGYRISSSNLTKLAIYDPLGRVVATLVNEVQSAGEYRIPWDASNLSPGLYFYQLITGSGRMAKKILYIK